MSTVLVVDDRATNRELARVLLTYGGHQVIEAHEGAEALSMAHAQHPDLILTDILMPGMDGYQLARELRAAPDTAATPIVFYTANYQESETRPFAEACGVARVLLKSTDPQVLIETVDELLAERRALPAPIDTARAGYEHLRAVSAKLFDQTKSLHDTEMRFRSMADSSPVGIAFGDRHGSAEYINPRLAEIMRLPGDDLLGLGWLRCADDLHRDEICRVAGGIGPDDVQRRCRTRVAGSADETLRWLNVHVQTIRDEDGEPAGFIATIDDVTTLVDADRKRRAAERQGDLDARDRATERLDSLSTLAGGVAHDFNNILGSILAFESFVSEAVIDLTDSGTLAAPTAQILLADLAQIRKGGQRAAGLTQQLLTFGSRTIVDLSAVDLNQAVRESNDLLTPTIGKHVRVSTELSPGLRPVLAEPTRLAQILHNLTINAVQAMPDGGTLTITTCDVDITDLPNGEAPPTGTYARLTLHDSGHGMSAETLKHAFEPFFTTRGRGIGTGLGLATVYGIVNQLGGIVRITSAAGDGTTVTIHLRTTDRPVETPEFAALPAGGIETILIAEDEDGIRDALTRTLSAAGYTVLAAPNGDIALDLAEDHPEPIHLLLSDVVMPGMLGDELAMHLHERRPAVKVLFMSGYAGDLMNRYGVLQPGVSVLPKPFTKGELLTAIRAIIDVATG
jgi:PAS domain S-box-containing protein